MPRLKVIRSAARPSSENTRARLGEVICAGADAAQTHVGYFLIAEGISRLEAETSYRARVGERLRRAIKRHASVAYLGTLCLLTVLILTVMGVALVPRLTAQAEIARGQLAALTVREMKLERRLHLIYRKGATLSHAARAFLRVAKEMQKTAV